MTTLRNGRKDEPADLWQRVKLPPRKTSKVIETDLVIGVRNALNRLPDVVLFRNNTGMHTNDYGSKVRYGLAVGSSDLVGLVAVVRYRGVGLVGTAELLGRFFALEVKRDTVLTDEQIAWGRTVQEHGGFWREIRARTVDEAIELSMAALEAAR